jgi:hypothetical protein
MSSELERLKQLALRGDPQARKLLDIEENRSGYNITPLIKEDWDSYRDSKITPKENVFFNMIPRSLREGMLEDIAKGLHKVDPTLKIKLNPLILEVEKDSNQDWVKVVIQLKKIYESPHDFEMIFMWSPSFRKKMTREVIHTMNSEYMKIKEILITKTLNFIKENIKSNGPIQEFKTQSDYRGTGKLPIYIYQKYLKNEVLSKEDILTLYEALIKEMVDELRRIRLAPLSITSNTLAKPGLYKITLKLFEKYQPAKLAIEGSDPMLTYFEFLNSSLLLGDPIRQPNYVVMTIKLPDSYIKIRDFLVMFASVTGDAR